MRISHMSQTNADTIFPRFFSSADTISYRDLAMLPPAHIWILGTLFSVAQFISITEIVVLTSVWNLIFAWSTHKVKNRNFVFCGEASVLTGQVIHDSLVLLSYVSVDIPSAYLSIQSTDFFSFLYFLESVSRWTSARSQFKPLLISHSIEEEIKTMSPTMVASTIATKVSVCRHHTIAYSE